MERVRATGAVIEVCPTSNVRIAGVTDPRFHPIRRFLESGMPFVVATDNPGTFDSSLSKELDWVCEHTGGGDDLRRTLVAVANQARSQRLSGRATA